MREFISVDAGGTSSRAVVVSETGLRLGAGRGGSGNPTSGGLALAADSVAAAIGAALGSRPGSGVEAVLVAHAGGDAAYASAIEERIAPLGITVPVEQAGDVTALFASGTAALDGVALIAGTGAIGGALAGGALARTVDGTGWLLGDAGSGFWIGHHVARAVVDDLDGGRATALTAPLLARFGLEPDAGRDDGRPAVLGRLIRALYALRPVELSGFAPLAFEHPDDAIASQIVDEALGAVAKLLVRVRGLQPEGPLVLGGSVLVEGFLRLPEARLRPFLDLAGDPIPVADGLVGAAVLTLRAHGVEVDGPLHATLASSIRA